MEPDLMSAEATTAAVSPAVAGELSIPPRRGGWRPWVGGLLSLGLFAAILVQLGPTSSAALEMLLRLSPWAWAAFALLYLTQPLADFVIFRRLWRLPPGGFAELLRKNVINEIVFGYSGEAYLYLWARRRTALGGTAFGAIKDVSILSAVMGNLLTLALAVASATRLRDLDLADRIGPALWLGIIPVAVSIVILAFGRRAFSLPARELVFVACVHVVRLAATSGLTVLVWRLALPDVSLGVWVVLLALRLLVTRIPFLTNKELVFGNLVLMLAGPSAPVAGLLAALALANLVAHCATITLLGARDLLRGAARR